MTPAKEAAARHYNALVQQMDEQRKFRRDNNRRLGPGDLVRDHIGGEIRQVTEVWSGGAFFEAKANERAQLARK